MEQWQLARGPASVRLLLDYGKAQGLSPATLLSGTGVTLTQLSFPEIRVTPSQELAVVRNLLAARPAVMDHGLSVGLGYHLSAFGLVGLGMMSCATPFDALLWGYRYLSLTYTFAKITWLIDDDAVTITFKPPPMIAGALQAFVMARAVGALIRVVGDVAGSFASIRRIALRGQAPPAVVQADLHERIGCRPTWDEAGHTLILALDTLRQPSPQANPTTAAMCQRMCSDLIDSSRATLSTAAIVRDFLAATPDGRTRRLGDVASLLCLSARTLKRRLRDEDASFSGLLRDSRLARARALLANRNTSLTEIAWRLGFSDLSSFSQAYRRWTGVAPSLDRQTGPARPPDALPREWADYPAIADHHLAFWPEA